MTEPLVSVKMITYNHAPFIAQAIEGVLQQKTNFPFELIVGEDCSTDGTREIVFEYQKKYPDIIRVITSSTNVGMKKNGLRTLKAGQGKYIAFCEGDDCWHNSSKLQKQVDYLEGHPECGMVYSSYDIYHVESKIRIKDFIKYKNWKMPENPSISDIVEGKAGISPSITTCTVTARRGLCEEIIEDDPYLHQNEEFLMGDTQLWAEIATKAKLHYIPESLATRNITSESATRSRDDKKVCRFGISGAKLQMYVCDKYNLSPIIRLKHEGYLLDCSLRLAFYTRDSALADEVRNKKNIFTIKEWIRYFGAKYMIIHGTYSSLAYLLNLFRKKHSQWR